MSETEMHSHLKNNPDFCRLRLGGPGPFRRSSHWLGKDHLLVVEIGNYAERYRRFYFRDLQAVVIQRTRARTWWNFFWWCVGLLLLTWVGWGIVEETTSGWQSLAGTVAVIVIGSISLSFLAAGAANTLRGPTCAVHFRTAVQTQKVRGITRWRKAEELVATLTPLIQSAQPEPAQPAEVQAPESAGVVDPPAVAAPPILGETTA